MLGSVWVFAGAAAFTALWGMSGPVFDYSDTWQLTMNTVASVVTFLMVFVIQNTENRNARSVQLKLDELLRALDGARSGFIGLEDLPDRDIDRLQKELARLRDDGADRDRDGA